ncbi:MAG: hypothetical protein DMG98_08080 [Acidobacteria bacterium]|nr:MAG: hypothetical protein DMG98_08080 [Acidobacteriota bacterium]
MQTTVAQILGWAFGPDPLDSTLRTGRELTLYQITTAYLQNARLISFDCDVHFEISDTPDKNAPRVIVETAIDSEYCPSRKAIEGGLAQHHFQLQYIANADVSQAELPQALPVSVLGLAFRDFEHNRGSVEVGTPWDSMGTASGGSNVTVRARSPKGQSATEFPKAFPQAQQLS